MANVSVTTRPPTCQIIKADHLDTILRGRPGLLLGPGLTLGAGCLAELARDLGEGLGGPENLVLFSKADSLVGSGIAASDIRARLRTKIEKTRPSPIIDLVVKTRWSAVLSASIDPYFEQGFQLWCDKSPIRRAVTTITSFRQPIPPHTIPVYKLLGSSHRDDFVVTTNDYRVQQPLWHRALRDFANLLQGAPVLCIGMAEFPWVLLDLFAVMLSDPQLVPGPLLLLEDDPIARDGQLLDLAARGLRIANLSMTVGAFVTALQSSAKSGHTPRLPFDTASQPALEQLRSFSDFAVAVNSNLNSEVSATEVHRLRDLLFSPTSPSWEPFVHILDFPRTISKKLIERLRIALTLKNEPFTEIIVSGASATGKTTILKRAAFEIAKEGTLVLWLRPYFFQNGPAEVRRLCEQIAATKANADRRLLVLADDPLVLGTVRLDDLTTALKATGLEAVLVIGTRSTDVATADADLTLDIDAMVDVFEVPDRFDDAEWKFMPEYLVRLGIAPTIEAARASTSNAPGRNTRDVLGMLFWLLPETRQRITESVRDEYLRLGDRAAFSQVIMGQFNHTSDFVKDA